MAVSRRRPTMDPGGSNTPVGDVRFRLTADLVAGGSAEAVLEYMSGEELRDGPAITVYDSRTMFTGSAGASGWCAYMADAKRYEIKQLSCG